MDFFFHFSKWLIIIIYHRNNVPKCPPDFRESFSSHIATPINFGQKIFLTSKWPIWSWLSLFKALQNSLKMAIYDGFSRIQVVEYFTEKNESFHTFIWSNIITSNVVWIENDSLKSGGHLGILLRWSTMIRRNFEKLKTIHFFQNF